MMRHLPWLTAGLLAIVPVAQAVDVNGSVALDLRHYPSAKPADIDSTQGLELQLDAFHDFGNHSAVVEWVGYLDNEDAGRSRGEARQAYVRLGQSFGDVFIGHRQTFWGKAESRNVVDLINQRDAAANLGNEAKLGAPSVSLEAYLEQGDLALWYLPHFRPQTVNDPDSHPATGLGYRGERYQRRDGENADDLAARFAGYIGAWDYASVALPGRPAIRLSR